MYVDWTSIGGRETSHSVLTKLPPEDAKRVVVSVVKNVASQLGLASPREAKPSTLSTDDEVAWVMEVLCYGLSLPLAEHDTIKDCVNVYCEWMSGLLPEPKACVPMPIIGDPNLFARKILSHLYHLFVPRRTEAQEMIHRQAVLCHRVLRRIQDVVKQSLIMATETWEALLGFLLAINDALLAPPTVKDDVGDQLCERVLGVLYEIWLVACVKSFPSPSLWKTLREMCMNWRHRSGLVDQWNRVNLALLARMLRHMLGPNFPQIKISEIDAALVPAEMTHECVAQSWYRFLHSIGNPVELSRPELVSQTQSFYQYAIVAKSVVDPTNHPCLAALPDIFFKALQSISSMVDAFLGLSNKSSSGKRPLTIDSGNEGDTRLTNRPKCNSILHLFGDWLFEAAFIGMTDNQVEGTSPDPNARRRSSVVTTLEQDLPPAKFESGKAEAFGALCRIFCNKKTGEEISPLYLARFYLALQHGLKVEKGKGITETVAMIIVNSVELLRVDLEGVHIVLPHVVSALEMILPEKEVKIVGTSNINKSDLRRAAINILTSILPLPLHFQHLPLKTVSLRGDCTGTMDFFDLRPKVNSLLVNALRVETDPVNTQVLLGGLMLLIQDSGICGELRDESSDEEPNLHLEFVSASHLVCHRLISSWKSDVNTSLAALELLAGLARTKLLEKEALECKRTLKWICDYIVTQCSRPPPAHSKDLHSTIVAAFHCCQTWLLHHPSLMQDKECIATVLEVVELGISGSKSQNRSADPPIMKEDKQAQPASRRVRDAAESLLIVIFEQVDFFTTYCGAESLSSKIDEISLLHSSTGEMLSMLQATQSFRYFVLDNAILVGIYEDTEQDFQPKVSLIIRGLSGRSVWTLNLRHLPRHKSSHKCSSSNPGRPLPMEEQPHKHHVKPNYFPEAIDKIPLCKADKSIPAVESVALDDRSLKELDKLSHLIEDQADMEKSHSAEKSHVDEECCSPTAIQEFQTARLILSHLSLLRTMNKNIETHVPLLVALDKESVEFVNDVEALDRMSTRTSETVYVFYMKNGQKTPDEILNNVTSRELVDPHFLEFLSTLGWPVNVWHHCGWTGRTSTSWRMQTEPMVPPDSNNHGGSAFNGDHHMLYWADSESEIAFLVPSSKTDGALRPQDAFVEETPQQDRHRKLSRQQSTAVLTDVKLAVVWLENFEDSIQFPAEALMGSATEPGTQLNSRDMVVLYIQTMNNGLLKIKVRGHSGKIVLPLMDGMVIPRRVLGALVRLTAVNVADRRRLEHDNYQPPHNRRKLKIQEILQKYSCPMTEAEFFTHLFI